MHTHQSAECTYVFVGHHIEFNQDLVYAKYP